MLLILNKKIYYIKLTKRPVNVTKLPHNNWYHIFIFLDIKLHYVKLYYRYVN